MLDPTGLVTLLDALRPPPNHRLDLAVGTSYSLDLEAMLTAPVAFARYDMSEGDTDATPLGLLDSIRRHAQHIAIFVQAGQIKVPVRAQLLAFFESSVVAVKAPSGGVFHPKVWVLRFRENDTDVPCHRVLCASRNLTHDCSWDTILRLDSDEEGIPIGGTLPDLLRRLPHLAQTPIATTRRTAIEELADELAATRFAAPDGVDTLNWHSLGLGVDPPDLFPDACDRLLVVSPFLASNFLDRLPTARRRVLVSRPEAIDGTAPEARTFAECYVLRDDADAPAQEADDPAAEAPIGDGSVSDPRPADDPGRSLNGLHAKCYVIDRGDESRVLTGSANATNAGFGRNVEVLVELTGARTHLGVERILDDNDDRDVPSFRDLLEGYRPPTEPEVDMDEAADRLDDVRWAIASVGMRAVVVDAGRERYRIRYETDPIDADLGGLKVDVWPVTLDVAKATSITDPQRGLAAEFTMSIESITAFLAMKVTDGERATRFVVTAAMEGVPEQREHRILRTLLGSPQRLLRYLLLLLTDEAAATSDLLDAIETVRRGEGADARAADLGIPLLEVMLRALEHEPSRLAELERLVADLRADGDAGELLPEHFDEVWQPVWTVARERIEAERP